MLVKRSFSPLLLLSYSQCKQGFQPALFATSRKMASSSAGASTAAAPALIITTVNNTRIITLNRPSALNSLSLEMCLDIKKELLKIQTEGSNIGSFIVRGSGGRAFCAGGDVKSLYMDIVNARERERRGSSEALDDIGSGKQGVLANDFFRKEYEMNYLLGTSSVPQVSLWDGIVMGGGVGLSVLGEFRVATENTLFAMPETAIGLFPDVGSSGWLPHLPEGQGLYIGLTGCRLNAADLISTGIATHFVPSDMLQLLQDKMTEKCTPDPATSKDIIKDILGKLSMNKELPGAVEAKATIEKNREVIKRCFHNKKSIEEIFVSLEAEKASCAEGASAFATTTLATLAKMSPTSLKVTMHQLEAGRDLDLKGCLEMEFRVMMRSVKAPDFSEGIRALLVDKDNKPAWTPSAAAAVDEADVAGYFRPLEHVFELRL